MLSNLLDRISFLALFLLIILLPLFFLPFTKIPIETSKGLLLVAGLSVCVIFWAIARFSDGKIKLPKSPVLLAGAGIVLVFFLSALFSGGSQVSFFGTMLDVGSFWFIFAGFLLMFMSSIIFRNPVNAKKVLFGSIIFSVALLVFQALRFFMPEFLSLGILSGKTDNILGSWSAFGIYAGFSALMSLFVIEFFSISRTMKMLFGVLLVLSLLLVASVNLQFVWVLLGLLALIIFVYKISFFSAVRQVDDKKAHFPALSFAVVMLSLLFFMSGVFISEYIPNRLGLVNNEVSPSFVATAVVSKLALTMHPLLGVGPNRFAEVWASYKPASVNASNFWDISFNFGSGLLPTFASTTGSLGILAWLIFFFLFIKTGLRSLFYSLKNSVNQEMTAFFVMSLYLFIASFFFPTGSVIFLLALAFSGVFIGMHAHHHANGEISISFLNDPRKSFLFILFLVFIMIVSAATSFKYMERLVSVPYFGKAVTAETIADAESSITKAITLYSNDLYLRTYAQIYLLKLNSLVPKDSSSLSDSKKAELQSTFDQAVNGAVLATTYNSADYLNFVLLGSVYQTVGSFGVTGAYDKAMEAYKTASVLNPLNPGIKLAMARTSFANGKIKEAKDYAHEALSLKRDYIDALVALSQMVRSEGDNQGALSYAEAALSFSSQSQALIQYVNSLKNSGSSPVTSSNNSKKK